MIQVFLFLKRLFALSLLLVVFAQIALYVHHVEHMLEQEHQDCPICLLADHQSAVAPGTISTFIHSPAFAVSIGYPVVMQPLATSSFTPRAPPVS